MAGANAISPGSLVKPFLAIAYGEQHGGRFPTVRCLGSRNRCWLPRGHGNLGLEEAIAQSCNAYFLELAAGLDRQRAAQTFSRYGLAGPPMDAAAESLAGLGSAWKEPPLAWARAYLQLENEQRSPAQSRIVKGMLDSAEHGTARAVDAALGRNAALAKTGTAACSHTPRGAADGFTVVLYPAAQPRLLLLVRVHGVTGAASAKVAGAMLCARWEAVSDAKTETGWGALFLLLLAAAPATAQQEIRFGVLGLFHPKELILQPEGSQVLSVAAQGGAGNPALVLNGEPGHRQIVFRAEGDRVVAGPLRRQLDGSPREMAERSPSGSPCRAISSRLSRPPYDSGPQRRTAGRGGDGPRDGGGLDCGRGDGRERTDGGSEGAGRGHALLSGRRAKAPGFRLLRHHPLPVPQVAASATSRVTSAVQATRGLVLAYRGKPLAAMYSSRCGGQTHSLRDVGLMRSQPGDAYPYYSVRCQWCRRHPASWQSRIGASGQPPQPGDERRRIAEARQWGWSAIPGSDFTATAEGAGWRLEGHSVGHGVGMCQLGATGMAARAPAFARFSPITIRIQS
jgi:hypothetical protein